MEWLGRGRVVGGGRVRGGVDWGYGGRGRMEWNGGEGKDGWGGVGGTVMVRG